MRFARPALVVALLGSLAASGLASAEPLPGAGIDQQCFAHTKRIDPMPDANGTLSSRMTAAAATT